MHPLLTLAEAEEQERYQELEDLEAYRKGTADAPVIYRSGYSKASDEDSASMDFVASEESEDRYGDVIEADGWQLSEFRRNPVFLFAHDNRIPPVGRVSRIGVEDKQLLASVRWDMDDDFARKLQGKYNNGYMRAVSVGFRPLEFEERGNGGLKFKQQELFELSAVPVPAHPRALKKAFEIIEGKELIELRSRLEIVERTLADYPLDTLLEVISRDADNVMPPLEPKPIKSPEDSTEDLPQHLAEQLERLIAAVANKES